MTAGERLVVLSGMGSNPASAHLLSIGAGATAGALLVSRSSLGSATAGAHLLDGGPAVLDWLIRARRRGRR